MSLGPGPLDARRTGQVRHLVALAAEADRVEPLGEQTLLDLADPAAVHATATDGDLVGYGQLGPQHGTARTIELVVAPDARRAGLGGALLDALLAEAAREDMPVRVWTHGSLPAARLLAQRRGLVPVRELWRMARAVPGAAAAVPGAAGAPADRAPVDGPPLALPPGVRLRAFEPGRDEHTWLVANAAAFAHHPEQGRMGPADLHARMAEPWFEPADLLLAEGRGGVMGFAWLKVVPPEGELYVLGVVPAAQGAGLGRALTRAALEHLGRRGVTRAVLFTDADNEPATRTYAAAGFVTDRVDTQYAPAPADGHGG